MKDGIHVTESLDEALEWAGQTDANRQAVVALVKGTNTRWWGGSIDDWTPDETLLSSQSSLDSYRKLVNEFKYGRIPKAHAVMVYRDGTFAAVMLGIKTKLEAGNFLMETMDVVRARSTHVWLKA
jgi:hypothetical protein